MSNVFKKLWVVLAQIPSTILQFMAVLLSTLFRISRCAAESLRAGWQHNHRLIFAGGLAIVTLLNLSFFLEPASFAASSCTTGLHYASATVDGVTVNLCTPFLPSAFASNSPDSAMQVASAYTYKPFQDFSITAVPYGTQAPTELLPVAQPQGEAAYRTALHKLRVDNGSNPETGPTATFFGKQVTGEVSLIDISVNKGVTRPTTVTEWVVEAGNRIWIFRISQEQAITPTPKTSLPSITTLNTIVATSNTLDQPSTSLKAMKDAQAKASSTPKSVDPHDVTTPWWNGDCDSGNNPGSYPLGSSYAGVKTCGPLGGLKEVQFFPGAWGEYEWQCVEYVMRYMYLIFGVNPYGANGNSVVSNYPGGHGLTQVSNSAVANVLPAPGDILSFDPASTGGHTAVVSSVSVNSSGNGTINIVDENDVSSGTSKLTVSNWYVGSLPVASGHVAEPVTGWLHNGTVPAQLPQGDYNDYTCANGLRGWAWDPKAPGTSINVDMYADGNGYINRTLANIDRPDVASQVSHDNGLHGFLIPIPASLRDGKTHTIHIYAINTDSSGSNPEINDSPTTINCPAVPQGSFDSVSCTTIWGWAWDPKAPGTSINVHLYDGSTIVGGYTANVYRSDVASQVSHDNGLHGFSIPFPDSLRDGKTHILHIFAINTDSNDLNPEITQSPQTIQCYQVGQGSSYQANFQDAYNRNGGINVLGAPTEAAHWFNNDSNTGLMLQGLSNGGAIMHNQSGGSDPSQIRAFKVRGVLYDTYIKMGGPLSSLGQPTSDEFSNAQGNWQTNFSNGYIVIPNSSNPDNTTWGTPQAVSWPSNTNSGWYAQYYNNSQLYSGPSLVQNEANDLSFSYNWNGNAPFPQLGVPFNKNWSAEWQRSYTFQPANYTATICGDNVRLYLGNNLDVDQWQNQSYNCYTDNFAIFEATTIPLTIKYANVDGNSNFSFKVTSEPLSPYALSNLSATAKSSSEIDASWTNPANANATGIYVERKIGANGTYSRIATLAATATSYQDIGLSGGTTYYYRVQAYNAGGTSDYSNEANATTAPLYTYHLPFVANNGAGINGNYTTNLVFQNMGSAPANFTITYYGMNGNTLATDNDNGGTLAPNTKYNATGLASGQSGAATIVSTQPLSIVVSENGTFNGKAIASSYPDINTTTGVGTTIYAPIALNHSYGAFSTGFMLHNTGTGDDTATIQYYSDNGNLTSSQTVSIKAQNTVQVLQSDAAANLPNNFSGWAVITSNNGQPLAGIDVETNPDTGFVATVACTATPGKNVFVPVVFQNAFGNFVTGMQLVNPNGTVANVKIQIYRKDGTLMQLSSDHASFQIPAHGDKSFFHSAQVFPELVTSNGGFVGTAIVTSDQPLLSMVNQIGSVGSVNFNGSFGTILSGASQVNMPSVFKNASAFSSGLQIVNTSSTASTATVTYYDTNGNKVYQAKLTADDGGPIKPGGSINPYQGTDSNLPDGFSGTAVITADTSGASFVVVGNISDGKIFYTYAEPN